MFFSGDNIETFLIISIFPHIILFSFSHRFILEFFFCLETENFIAQCYYYYYYGYGCYFIKNRLMWMCRFCSMRLHAGKYIYFFYFIRLI